MHDLDRHRGLRDAQQVPERDARRPCAARPPRPTPPASAVGREHGDPDAHVDGAHEMTPFALCSNGAQACVIHAAAVLKSYLPALVFIVLGIGVGVVFTAINSLAGPKRPSKVKTEPYECGLPSEVARASASGSAST